MYKHPIKFFGPLALLIFAVLWGIIVLCATLALAHDAHYALSKDMKTWFDGLKSKEGPCCSDADGNVLQDVDWESNGTGYRVRIDGKWIDVPPSAVISEPNRYGPTMVWPLRTGGWNYDTGAMDGPVTVIRCFMPGSMG